ncbi:DNA-binding protein [Hujiaoplasma nucleasis]|uniref:DNA-binding protein n=1 Tax=Hujiaoplasma nucleasis TaxID=2725268 RepID=A0A7L6N5B7_9MOLU|nr:S1-like domain-containing RNA-binding protein [Hujiaoplasma nucleasis]QLY39769.1 DNA-binding protein [Hujiaoplasma nucleasis]
MELGKTNTLRVLRETDISYLLTDGLEEVFLHKKEALQAYEDHQEIDVFVYKDNEGRLTASTKTPLLEKGGFAKLEIVGLNPKYGVFLNFGLVKDLLLSLDDLPGTKDEWPQVGDHLFVTMKESKDRLFAHILSRNEMSDRFRHIKRHDDIENIEITIMFILENGVLGYSDLGHEVFIHRNNYRRRLRLGEKVSVHIIQKNERNFSGQLIEQKELMLDNDAQVILDYLNKNDGLMKYTDKTDPLIISKVFHMSKSAFKRALGKLYKEGHVELEKTQTKLKR